MNVTILSTRFVLIVLGVLTLASVAVARQRDDRRGPTRAEQRQKVGERLNITPQQKEQIRANREKFMRENAAAIEEIKALREKMKEYAQNHDVDNVKAIREEIKTKLAALRPAREEVRKQMRELLTPEQRAELERVRAERKQRLQERRKEWRKRHRG